MSTWAHLPMCDNKHWLDRSENWGSLAPPLSVLHVQPLVANLCSDSNGNCPRFWSWLSKSLPAFGACSVLGLPESPVPCRAC